MGVKDCNGNTLADGNSVTVVKVKGASVTIKRGTLIKNIRLTDDEESIECNAEKVKGLELKICFVKKARASRVRLQERSWQRRSS